MRHPPALIAAGMVSVVLATGGLVLWSDQNVAPRGAGPSGVPAVERASGDPAAAARFDAQLARLAAEIARLEADTGNRLRELEIHGLTLERIDRVAADVTAAAVVSAPATAEPLSGAPSDGAADDINAATVPTPSDRSDAIQAQMESHMINDPFDARWAPVIEDTLTGALRQPGFSGSELVDIECRTTLCRLGLDHSDLDAEQIFLHRFMGAAGLTDAEAFYRRNEDADGRVRMTFYVARDGGRLPQLTLRP